jgi:hypothetical protein
MVPVIAGVVAVAFVSGLLGALVAGHIVSRGSGDFRVVQEQPATVAVTSIATPTASVNGINVNLRTGPGLGFPVTARLLPGEGVVLRDEREGWFAATTMTGMSGWVFGAFLRGSGSPDRGAAVVRQLLTSNASGPFVVLRPGDKVFFVQDGAGQVDVILPTGRRLRVAPEALVRVE